jgi:hypothetical protein
MTTYLDLPGVSGSFATSPAHTSDLDVTDGIVVEFDVTLPGVPAVRGSAVSLWNDVVGQQAWNVGLLTDGRLTLWWRNSTTATNNFPVSNLGAVRAGRRTYKVQVDAATGLTSFLEATSWGATYVSLGTASNAGGALAVANASTALKVGGAGTASGEPGDAFVHRVRVSRLDGTVIANPIFSAFAAGDTSGQDQTGKTWTVNGTAAIVDDGTFAVGSTEALNGICQENYGLDLNGALRKATGINKDVNGIAYQKWGRESHACRNQIHALLSGGEVAEESAPPNAGMTLVYADDFDTDTGVWVPEPWYPSDVSGDTYSIADSVLTVRAFQADSYGYGEIGSLGARAAEAPFYPNAVKFNGGYFEARMRFTADPTVKASFWMLCHAHPNAYPGSHCPTLRAEWDIMEHLLTDGVHEVTSSLIRNNTAVCGEPASLTTVLHEDPGQLMSDWHVWSGLWTPTEVLSYLDGQLFARVPTYDSTDQDMYLLFLVSGNGTLPVYELEVDWVRVWQ